MYCNECGTHNAADSKYCKECGAKINMVYRTMMLSAQDLQDVDDTEGRERLTRLLDMAFWHNEAGHVDAAIRACNAALGINPSSTTAHSLLGTLYEKNGDDARAIEQFESVLALNPDSEADAAKLNQLRSGIHAGPVPQPISYRWVPPALAGFKFAALPDSLKNRAWTDKMATVRSKPALAAGIAAAVVMALGLLLVKPSPQKAQALTPRMASAGTSVPVTMNRASFGNAMADPVRNTASLQTPIVMPPPANRPAPPVVITRDPFSETLPGANASRIRPFPFVPYQMPHPRGVSRTRMARGGHGLLPPLPPLKPVSLTAIPLAGGVAPAPISMSVNPVTASVANVPQHTVVVSPWGSAPAAPMTAATNTGYSSPGGSIHITIEKSGSDDASTASVRPVSHEGGGSQAEAFQQTALSLQQQGDYRQARQHYEKAIRAYKEQIAAGRDAETAERGLEVCQTGLQICQQSQP